MGESRRKSGRKGKVDMALISRLASLACWRRRRGKPSG